MSEFKSPTDFQRVAESLKLKKGDDYCARKLGMDILEYQGIKRALKKLQEEEVELESLQLDSETTHAYTEDLIHNTAEYKFKSDTKPRSIEEVELLIKLDKTKWKIQKYAVWNAGKEDKWLVSVKVGPLEKIEDFSYKFMSFMENWKSPHSVIHATHKLSPNKKDSCLLLNKQDPHYNKTSCIGSNDIKQRFEEIQLSILGHIQKAKLSTNLKKIVYVIGSDQFNAEWTGMTTKFTPQTNLMSYEDSFQLICEHEVEMIDALLHSTLEVEVIILGGNHDQYVSWHMGSWLKAYYKNQPGITIDNEMRMNKYFRYDDSAVMLNHGDVQKPEKLAQTFPIEFKKEWALCNHYYICTGDRHTEHSKSIGGIKFYQIPALSKAKSMWDLKQGHTTTPAEMTSFLITKGEGISDIYKTVL